MFLVLLAVNADFTGLVQVEAESKYDTSFQGQRKCSPAGRLLVTGSLGEWALEGGLQVRERLSTEAERDSRDVYSYM
jgi:hypothetical protein